MLLSNALNAGAKRIPRPTPKSVPITPMMKGPNAAPRLESPANRENAVAVPRDPRLAVRHGELAERDVEDVSVGARAVLILTEEIPRHRIGVGDPGGEMDRAPAIGGRVGATGHP